MTADDLSVNMFHFLLPGSAADLQILVGGYGLILIMGN